MPEKIRIKDIAIKAGVSVGTVDRVLHNRPNVSKPAREKVEKVLNEIHYQPNMYASALASHKNYTFICLIPKHEQEAYWAEIEEGARIASALRIDFHVDVEIVYYNRYVPESFIKVAKECMSKHPDGMVIVPSALEPSLKVAEVLHNRSIPFVLLDSYMADLKPLSFYGQDSFSSGYFAGRMLMLLASGDQQVMLMKQTKDGSVMSKQQEKREVVFRHYMRDHFPSVEILDVNLPLGHDNKYDEILENFFTKYTGVHHCITFNSRAYLVSEYLLRRNRRGVQIMGYDMVDKNAECIRQGSISFLIAQHAYMQGYSCIMTLFDAIVLHKEVTPVNYMPIELLSEENVDFYRRTQL